MSTIVKVIPVTAAKVAGAESNYPALVQPSLMTGWGSLTLAEAQSLRFYSDEDLTTELAREVVSADEIHVKIASLTTLTIIYCSYDGVTADYATTATYGAEAVWADYLAVWHMQGSNASAAKKLDSSGNGYDLTEGNTPEAEAVDQNGNVDGAYSLKGFEGQTSDTTSYDFLQVNSILAGLSSNNFTFTGWLSLDIIPSTITGHFLYEENNGASGQPNIGFLIDTAGKPSFAYSKATSGGGGRSSGASATVLSTSTWYYLTGKVLDTSFYPEVKVNNGGKATGGTGTTGTFPAANNNFFVNRRYNTTYSSAYRYLDGQFGEARIRLDATSDNWDTTEYNNQSGVATFWGTVTDAYITTDPVTSIAKTTATGNGEVIDDQGATITERGFCWNTTIDPVITDDKVTVAGTTGVYSGSMTGLTPNTLYYVRAYYTNSLGTFYGDNVSHTTLDVDQYELVYDIGASDGEVYAYQVNVGGTVGSVTIELGSTGTSTVIAAGAGVTTVYSGTYSGVLGIVITRTSDFDGTIDDFYYSKTTSTSITWSDDTTSVAVAVASSVTFQRIEDEVFNSFRFYRYLDLLFKNLDGFVTITLRSEREDNLTEKTNTFSVGDTGGANPSPFQKRRISFLIKNQALVITLSNSVINETFSIAQFVLTGHKKAKKMFSPSKIISTS